uniref:Uncharacterized protein n=1 Tax=viral metagenome TaxID=1070528 RepID=A0A6C0LEK9_9ZZZZ
MNNLNNDSSLPSPPSPSQSPVDKKENLSIDYTTIEYSPWTYKAVDTISPWFNKSILMMNKDDVAIFMTDYMIIHDEIINNMKSALKKGAKFILGADRWYICGDVYTCPSSSNQCPSTNCTNEKPKPDNCNCNIPQADGCNSFNNILTKLDYCGINKNNIILMDSPSNKDDSKIWGHAHRKIINFYYKNTNNARIINGSWNIDADLNRRNLGVKETSLGITTKLDSKFAQYMLQMDIDTITPITMYVKNMTTDGLKLLKSLKTIDNYPKLPILVDIKWSADDINDKNYGNNPNKLNGIDKNVNVWLGISPPPQNPSNKFISPLNIVFDSANGQGDPNKWQDQYEIMLNKSIICSDNKPTYCNNNELKFASGATWAGLLFNKFFEESKKSQFINISMYNNILDAHEPCKYLDGGYGWTGCSPENNYHGPGWYSHGFPLMFPSIRDYTKHSTLRIIDGVFNNNNDKSWRPWMPSKLSNLSKTQTDNIHIKWFNQTRSNKGDFKCTDKCNSSSCCRNHEKLYMSDNNLLVSSGHPSRAYYSDIDGINNDILYLNASGLTKIFNDHFKIAWEKQSVTVNSKIKEKQKWWSPSWDNLTTPTIF